MPCTKDHLTVVIAFAGKSVHILTNFVTSMLFLKRKVKHFNIKSKNKYDISQKYIRFEPVTSMSTWQAEFSTNSEDSWCQYECLQWQHDKWCGINKVQSAKRIAATCEAVNLTVMQQMQLWQCNANIHCHGGQRNADATASEGMPCVYIYICLCVPISSERERSIFRGGKRIQASSSVGRGWWTPDAFVAY